ncbi:hemerythrin domain-containing protein [Plebeiibacterium marinum]|uniref:Hemerythrin domain-containing protein n=1 Tax=Plebeiibacterium marinum TaxID=2992111 RepID=A0AAE3MFZ5_9BACT|nr:hemerythrin domain-containing protein [Plebeiobacterium marinum]MCW3807094.1 hemerythrin domain-containing protein [Plebeiobacterium marinum]
MLITADMKMADLIHLDFQLLAVIQRIGIPLGFREKTIDEVCKENNVNTDFFLQISNSFHDKDFFPKERFFEFKAEWLVNFLRRTHQCILEHKIPEIELKIEGLVEDLKATTRNYELIKNFFTEYIRELKIHMELEDNKVFPYVVELDKSLEANKKTPKFEESFSDYNIQKYLEDHNDIEEKVFDLKNILIKYLPPPMDNCKYNSLLFEIFRLEKDLSDHAKLEDKVLIPKVKLMEREIKNL